MVMESQDMRMCKTESVFSSGVAVDYNNNNGHRVYEEDCFGDILNMLDFPMESLEGDGFAEDWASKLGPIPCEVFREVVMPTPASQIGGGTNNFASYTDSPLDYPALNNRTSQQKYSLNHDEGTYRNSQNVNISHLKQQTTSVEERKQCPIKRPFQAPSPNSVLESRTSSSNNKGVSFGTENLIPVATRGTRSKRAKPTTNPWLISPFVNIGKKLKEPSQIHVTMGTKRSLDVGIKKCAHCEITETPQWREGPMGPKTLCNACGVRYRSGRLYPEYRPAASPTFVPALHSNSHRRVVEMRKRAVK